jgi:hypothetical protein
VLLSVERTGIIERHGLPTEKREFGRGFGDGAGRDYDIPRSTVLPETSGICDAWIPSCTDYLLKCARERERDEKRCRVAIVVLTVRRRGEVTLPGRLCSPPKPFTSRNSAAKLHARTRLLTGPVHCWDETATSFEYYFLTIAAATTFFHNVQTTLTRLRLLTF